MISHLYHQFGAAVKTICELLLIDINNKNNNNNKSNNSCNGSNKNARGNC